MDYGIANDLLDRTRMLYVTQSESWGDLLITPVCPLEMVGLLPSTSLYETDKCCRERTVNLNSYPHLQGHARYSLSNSITVSNVMGGHCFFLLHVLSVS